MKRILVTILSIIYFCISSGFVMSVHYCMGKVSKVNVEITPSKMCGCGTKETKSCCKTESKFIKLSDNYQATYADISVTSPFHFTPAFYTISNTTVVSINTKLVFKNHPPPVVSQEPIYILNCVFRI